jgi:hypothetical protein
MALETSSHVPVNFTCKFGIDNTVVASYASVGKRRGKHRPSFHLARGFANKAGQLTPGASRE